MIDAVDRPRPLILNYDAVAFCMPHLEGDEMIDSMFASTDLPGAPRPSIFWNWGEGNVAPWKSDILEPFTARRFARWAEEGFDVVGRCHEETKKRGLESFFSYRINGGDNDRYEDGRHHADMPKFKEAHPECLIHYDKSIAGQTTPKYDFSKQAVRDHKIAILAEVLDNYDFDGIDIDYARATPVLPPGKQWVLRDTLTEFMIDLRAMVEEKAAVRGHPILIAARIPATLFGCRFDGIDIEEWVASGLVDILTLGSRSYEVDYLFFNQLMLDTGVKCYPCIDDIHATDGYRNPPIDVFRGVFTNWKHQGFEGVTTFNFYTCDPKTPGNESKEVDDWMNSQWDLHKQVYEELGRGIDDLPKTFVIQRRLGGHFHDFHAVPESWKTPRESWFNSNIEAQLPAHLNADEDQDVFLRLYVGMNPSEIKAPVLRIVLSENEAIQVRINGSLALHSTAIVAPTTEDANWYEYPLDPSAIAEGENLIQISMARSIRESIWVEKVELSTE